jgi:hypothetical protein
VPKGTWHFGIAGNPRGDAKRENWLPIKGKDAYAEEDGEAALKRFQKSIVSRRSMDAITKGDRKWTSKEPEQQPKSNPKGTRKRCRAFPLRQLRRLRTSFSPELCDW